MKISKVLVAEFNRRMKSLLVFHFFNSIRENRNLCEHARLSNDKSTLNFYSVISLNHSRTIIGNIVEIRDLKTDNSSSEALSTS